MIKATSVCSSSVTAKRNDLKDRSSPNLKKTKKCSFQLASHRNTRLD